MASYFTCWTRNCNCPWKKTQIEKKVHFWCYHKISKVLLLRYNKIIIGNFSLLPFITTHRTLWSLGKNDETVTMLLLPANKSFSIHTFALHFFRYFHINLSELSVPQLLTYCGVFLVYQLSFSSFKILGLFVYPY